jgi:uncharacterized integral membrane protein (TIGR00698 family)
MSLAVNNPDLFASLDSFEGIPDVFEPRIAPESRAPWQRKLHDVLVWIGVILPGIGLAWGLAWIGQVLSVWIGATILHIPADKGSPISPIMLAILLGLIIRNSIGVPTAYEQGLRLCIKTVLRIGIVLLGLKLTVLAIAEIGKIGIPIIIVCISVALLAVTLINRALGLPKRLGTLIAVGTSICGVSAIVATAPVIEAEDDETSYAVACITLFGLLALFVYPFLSHSLFRGNDTQAGLFLGTAIHDTSQVAGAGLMYKQQFNSETALKIATAVKLMRNLAMSILIPFMAIAYHNSSGVVSSADHASKKLARQKWHQAIPLFVIGFAMMACIRSIGDLGGEHSMAFGMIARDRWHELLKGADFAAVWCLTIAMAAVGLGTGLAKLRGLGAKPFSVGFAAALLVGGVSVALIKLLTPLIHVR